MGVVLSQLSFTALLPYLCTCIILYWIFWVIYARTLHPLAKYPGPLLASISRIWIAWRVWVGDADVVERELHRKYGHFVRIAPDEVSISDPAALRQIYNVNSNYTKTDFYTTFKADFSRIPDLFTQTDEKMHAERRRIVNHLYSMSSVVQSEQYIDNCLEVFMKKMARIADDNGSLDLVQWMQWYTFDVIGELYFSRMFGFLEREQDHEHWLSSFERLLPVLAVASVLPTYVRTLLLISSLAIPGTGSALKRMQTIYTASEACVTHRLAQLKGKKEVRDDILQRMMKIHKEKGSELDFQMIDIQVEVYVGLVAGSDTTMAAIVAVFYYLLKTPVSLAKLVKEIDEAARGNQLSKIITYREASKLPYLGACIKEGIRLFPSVALTFPRHVPAGGDTICGEYIPAGYRVGVSAVVIHRDESCFGPNVDTFEPERWLRPGSEVMERHFFAFGSGARTCIGKNISLCEIYKIVPLLLRDYNIELKLGSDWEWTTFNHWFCRPKDVPIRIQRRHQA